MTSESVLVSPEDQIFTSFWQKSIKLILVKHYIDLRTTIKTKLTELLLIHLNYSFKTNISAKNDKRDLAIMIREIKNNFVSNKVK